jgi:hypothetical protein
MRIFVISIYIENKKSANRNLCKNFHIEPNKKLAHRNIFYTEINMFRKLFKRKTELEKLHEQHAMLLDKAFKASTVNRTLSDELMAKAYEVEQKILEQARDKRD